MISKDFSNSHLKSSSGFSKHEAAIACLIVAAVILAVISVVVNDPSAKTGSGLGEDFKYDISKLKKIDPELIHYKETAHFKIELNKTRAISSGPGDEIYVAGDRKILRFDRYGNLISQFTTSTQPTCLTVSEEKTIYAGLADHVEVYDSEGAIKATWKKPEGTPFFTSIAVKGDNVFVADFGNRALHHYAISGKPVLSMGKKDEARNIPGIIAPSPYLDILIADDGLIRSTNPGMFRIEAYTTDGDLELHWGKRSDMEIADFCGCCNPSHIAQLPEGGIVTCEKGLMRIKVYNIKGVFQSVVAGPESFPGAKVPPDIATDSQGRILVLDSSTSEVRIFTKTKDGNLKE